MLGKEKIENFNAEKEQMEISKGRKGQIKASNVSRSQNQEFQYLVKRKARKPIFGKPQIENSFV